MGDENTCVFYESSDNMQCLLFGDFREDEYVKYFNANVAVKFLNEPSVKKAAFAESKENFSLNSQNLFFGDLSENVEEGFQNDVITSWADAAEGFVSEDHGTGSELKKDVESLKLVEDNATTEDSSDSPVITNASTSVNQKHAQSSDIAGKSHDEARTFNTIKPEHPAKNSHVAAHGKPEPEFVKPVAQKPKSWASLFKSDKPNQFQSLPNILSVNVEQETTKEAIHFGSKNEHNEASSTVNVEHDEKAKALAGKLTLEFLLLDFLQKVSLRPENLPLKLRGLINNGNWCYINATLQSLLGCSAFYHLFKSMLPFKPKQGASLSTPLTDTMIEFVNEFSTLDVKDLNNRGGKKNDEIRTGISFEPKNVYEILSVQKTTLSETGKQQDAEEFLTFLLNGLHEEFASLNVLMQNPAKNNNSNRHSTVVERVVNGNLSDRSVVIIDDYDSDKQDGDNDDKHSADQWEQVGRNNKSATLRQADDKETLITKIFGGVTRSSVHHAGAKESASLQPFFTIQLDIQAENIWNINDAFENYFTKENLEGFTSSKTNAKVEASHKTSLEKLPRVLILHLKYFVYDKTGGCQKTHKEIEIERELEIPNDVLSQSLKGRVPASQRKYELFAIEFHHGKIAAGGHYTTAVKHKDPLGWVYCNDSIIQKTQFGQIFKHHKEKVPYLLFYERVNNGNN
eukprot:gene19115-21032_t